MMQLQINGKQKQRLWLTKSHYSIGNSANCDIRLADKSVRSLHAHLMMDGDTPSLVREEGAVVKLNGVPLEMESRLLHGDRIRIGNVQMQIRDSRQSSDLQKTDEPPLGWELQGMNPALSGKLFTIAGVMVVGRANECDIHLGEAHLSRRHAQLRVTADGLEVEDLDSANGTYVNGRRVSKAALKSGDELCFDTLRFRVIHTATTDETLIRPSTAHSDAMGEVAQYVAQEQTNGAAIESGNADADIDYTDANHRSDRHRSGHQSANATESGGGTASARANMENPEDPFGVHAASRDADRQQGKSLGEDDHDPQPAVPTAIEIQLETLRRQRDERRDLAGASSIQPVGGIVDGGRLALMMALVAVAGIIWGAMSFFDPSFFGAPASLVGNSIK